VFILFQGGEKSFAGSMLKVALEFCILHTGECESQSSALYTVFLSHRLALESLLPTRH